MNNLLNDDDLFLSSDKPVRADAVRNRELLLNTAHRLFREQGVAEVTMSAIAREAGVGKGTLYRHFGDKAELCHALLDEAMRAFQAETLATLRTGQDPYASLCWFLEQAVRYVYDNSDLLCDASQHGNMDMLAHPAHIWWRQTISGLLAQIGTPGDREYVADALYVLLDVQTIRFQLYTRGYSLQRVIDGLQALADRLVFP